MKKEKHNDKSEKAVIENKSEQTKKKDYSALPDFVSVEAVCDSKHLKKGQVWKDIGKDLAVLLEQKGLVKILDK